MEMDQEIHEKEMLERVKPETLTIGKLTNLLITKLFRK
jgi:hypothetical protein